MIRMIRKTAVPGFIAMVLLLSACATGPERTGRRYVWPRPPDQPRIEWLKSYYGENDFPKSGWTQFMELLLGTPKGRLFQKPIDIKATDNGVVYITDTVEGGIFVYDLTKEKIDFWGQASDPDAGLAITPYYLSLDADGNVYVVGVGMKQIFVLTPSGKVLRRIDFTDKVANPAGICVDNETKRIYLVDGGESKVAVFDLAGKFLFSFGKFGENDGEFNRPSPIIVNHKGEVVVGDTINARIQVFTRDGKFLRKFGTRGDCSACFQILKGVAVDSDDNIYVTDGKDNKLKIFSANGDFLIAIGSAYSVTKYRKEAPGGFLLPQGIYVDKHDTIYIADQANFRFQVFRYLKEGGPASQADPPKK